MRSETAPADRQPDEVGGGDRHRHHQRVGLAELQDAAAEGRRIDGDEIERDRGHDHHRDAAEHQRPVGGERLVDLGRRRMDLSRREFLRLLERGADPVQERHDRAADEERDAPAPVVGGLRRHQVGDRIAEQRGDDDRDLLARRLPAHIEALASGRRHLRQVDRNAAELDAGGEALQQPSEHDEQRREARRWSRKPARRRSGWCRRP